MEMADIVRLRAGLETRSEYDRDRLTVEAILYTGIHPVDLGEPPRCRARLRQDGQLERLRAKTGRATYVPIEASFRPRLSWILRYYTENPRTPLRVNQIVHATCRRFGMEWVTPRGLRHTFGQMAWWKYHDMVLVADWLGCSMETARIYRNAELTEEKAEIMQRGWFG